MDLKESRRAQRERRLGPNARCKTCGEADSAALVTRDLCYGCKTVAAGGSGFELHHPAGKANDPFTVRIPANDHRVLSDWQVDVPPQTQTNPDGSPLLKAAAWLRGFLDMLRLAMERGLAWIPPYLEHLDQALVDSLGPRYWVAFDGVPA